MIRTAAIIGCGKRMSGMQGFARGHATAKGFLEAYPDITLVGVDINADNLKDFGEAFDLPQEQLFLSTEAMYANLTPDIAAIITWPGLHTPQVQEAVKAGVKGILCEKPLALDSGEIDKIIKVTGKHNIPINVAHQRRHQGKFQLVRSLIDEGRFGDNIVLHARIGDGWDMLSWATHWFDMANYFFGGPPESILAGLSHQGQRRYGHAVEDESIVFAEYSDTRQAVFISGPNALIDQGFMIEGEKATGKFVKGGLALMSPEGVEILPFPKTPLGADAALCYELGQAIEHGTPMLCGLDDCAPATRMAYAAHESALTHKRVVLENTISFPPLELAQHAPTPSQAPHRITLLADAHHKDPETGLSTRDGLIKALEARHQTVHLVPLEEREVEAADLESCDLLMISHTKFKSSEQTRALVGQWIRAGKPTTIVHCGIGGWPDWQEFRDWCGFYWIWGPKMVASDEGKTASGHPHVPCTVQVTDTNAFATGWKACWLPRDEVYVNLHPGNPVNLLATAELDDVTQPIAWQNKDFPHITTWLPGHLPEIWDLPVMRDGVMACCQLSMTQGLEAQCPQPVCAD